MRFSLAWGLVLLALAIRGHAQVTTTKSNWSDHSPHRSGFVTANGVRLHYLDWGGQGNTLLFLHGDGESAHIFDDLAPQFTNRFRVLGLTRRGHGQSAQPVRGYDTGTLVKDIRGVLDVLKIRRATLTGHGRAGDELTVFASKYPRRVSRLIYFDAAYNHADGRTLIENREALLPPFPKRDNANYDAAKHWYQIRYRCTAPGIEAAIRESTVLHADGLLEDRTPAQIYEALAVGATNRLDYSKLKIPALSFYARGDVAVLIGNTEKRNQAQPALEAFEQWRQTQIDLFRAQMRNGQVVEMPDTFHYCFIQREVEVVSAMRLFLLGEGERR